MKTNEVIKMLNALASSLKNSHYENIEDIERKVSNKIDVQSIDVPRALSMLVALSSFDKIQWISIIKDYEFPIEIRPRDASRDIMGKLLTYLESNPDARNRLTSSVVKQRSHTSPELTRALEFLLKP